MIDLVEELPYFLLLFLIFPIFDEEKWGYFTQCPESKVRISTKTYETMETKKDAATNKEVKIKTAREVLVAGKPARAR